MVTNNATNTPQLAVKGDLMAGQTFPTIPVVLPIGSNNQVLTADSAQTAGMKWSFSGAGATLASFLATRSTDTAGITGNGTTATVVFNNTIFNNGSGYNNATGVFTAPITGIYLFNTFLTPFATTTITGSTTLTIVQFQPNTPSSFIVCQSGMAVNRNLDYCNIGAGGSIILALTATNTVSIGFGWYGLTGTPVGVRGTLSTVPRSFFSGALLEQTA